VRIGQGVGFMDHKAKVTRVIDGDTFEVTVDLDFCLSIGITVRVFGCDAWEVHGPQKVEGLEAKDYVTGLIAGNTIELSPHKRDSFGRWLCDVKYKNRSLVSYLGEHGYLKG